MKKNKSRDKLSIYKIPSNSKAGLRVETRSYCNTDILVDGSAQQDGGHNECFRIAGMLMRLFELWRITDGASLALLGLTEHDSDALSNFRSQSSFPGNSDFLERAAYLFSIHKKLRLLFRLNPELCYRWISTENRAFESKTPLGVASNGIEGLRQVDSYLNNAVNFRPVDSLDGFV